MTRLRSFIETALVIACLVALFAAVGRIDADVAEQHAREMKERMRAPRSPTPATFPPRCPDTNGAKEPLRLSIAQRRDGEHYWQHYCGYYTGEGTRL